MDTKLVVVGASAFGLGALISWAVTADHFERRVKDNEEYYAKSLASYRRKIVELQDAEIERSMEPVRWPELTTVDVEAAAAQVTTDILGSELPVEILEHRTDAGVGTENPPEENEVDYSVIPEGETPEETRTNLQALIDRYTANPEDIDTFTTRGAEIIHTRETPPFVISRELYASDPDEGDDYAKITLTFYAKDRMLVDDDEDVISEVDQYVGWRNLAQFGGESGDPDVVFVRNRRLLTDFEVVRNEEDDVPIHLSYGMSKDEFNMNKAAGVIKFRDQDSD